MKDFRGMKRQRNRNRKPQGNQNNPNRAYESNGPEGTKVRGNAQTIYEKYQQLARDANSSGDRVLAENHLQHAEHYFRMIRQMQPQRPVSEFVQRDPFSSGFDDYDDEMDMENESEAETQASVDEQPAAEDQSRYDNRGDRNNRMNGDRLNGNGNRNDRLNGERMNGERPRNFEPRNGNGDQRSFEPRNNNGEQRKFEPRPIPTDTGNDLGELNADGRRETRRERYERRRQQRFAEQQDVNVAGSFSAPQAPVAPAFIASTEPLGVANGRAPSTLTEAAPTTFDAPAIDQPVIREAPVIREKPVPRERPARREKAAPSAVDPSHLPAFLSRPTPVAAEAPTAEADEAPAKPKRGRKRKEDIGAAEEA